MKVHPVCRFVATLVPITICGLGLTRPAAAQGEESAASPLGELPLIFVENRGQWDDAARFVTRKGPLTARFEAGAMVLSRCDGPEGEVVRLTFEGASGGAWIEGEEPIPGVHNFFVGEPSSWRTGVPGYASLVYRRLYEAVDLRVRDRDGRLEYDVLLERAADLGEVVVRCDGVHCLEIDAAGNLVLTTALGELTQAPPVTWQVLPSGEQRLVECSYRRIDAVRYGFQVPNPDPDLPLVVDPGLEWSTFLGVNQSEIVQDVAIAPNGDVVACGNTGSSLFPTTTGAFSTTKGPGRDAFVVRMDPDGTGANQLVYATFLGGSGDDRANSISVDAQGLLTVVGRTDSANFPTDPSAYAPTLSGLRDAFVCQLDPTQTGANQLVYSTLVGGSEIEQGNDHHVDAAGVVTVVGWTESPGFPTTPGAYDTTHNGGSDVYALRLDPSLLGSAQLVYSTFLGDSGDESLWAGGQVDVDEVGRITIGGRTNSANFPTTAGAYAVGPAGGIDGFVSLLDPTIDGTGQLVASTYLGGNLDDNLQALSVDAAGVVTVAGQTASSNYPTTSLAYQPVKAAVGGTDAFVSRLDPALTTLIASTYLGGSGEELINGMDARGSGVVTVTGAVSSSNFPTTPGAYQEIFQSGSGPFGPYDAFVARFDPSLSQLLYSTFLGGKESHEFTYCLAVDSELAAVVGGVTQSKDFPTTPGAFDTSYGAIDDGVLAKLDLMPTGVQPYGASTPGCGGPLATGVKAWPKGGNSDFGFLCANGPANGIGLLILSVSKWDPPLPIVGVDAWINLLQIALMQGTSIDSAGYGEVPVPIPSTVSPSVQIYAQFICLPEACSLQGFSASNALEVTVQ